MFGFFTKKSDANGVLTNLKTVSRWLEGLPAGDIYSAQEKVVQNLIQFNHSNLGYGKDRLQVLMRLDEETREMQESLCQQYLRNPRMSKSIESRLWNAIHAFYWEITRSYHSFLMDFIANPGGSKIQTYIPQIAARGIRGFASIIKWRYFRYEIMDEKLWLRMHNIYRVAEFDNFANSPVPVYRGDSRPHSPAEEYGQALLLSPFGSGNLVPRDIEMVDRWLDNWSSHIRIDTLYSPKHHTFYVDTGKGQGAKRCSEQMAEPNLRFISTHSLLSRIKEVRAALTQGDSPATLGLTEDFRLPEGYNLLDQVEAEWSPIDQSERRVSPRSPQSGQWRVIHGLAVICGELSKTEHEGGSQGQLSPEAMLDIKLYGFVTERTKERVLEHTRESSQRKLQDLWEQRDASGNGISFVIGQQDSEWVKVGKLVAIRPLEEDRWQIGVVSRLARQHTNNRLVGVRLLSGGIQPVALKPVDPETSLGYVVDELDHPTIDGRSHALLLTNDDGNEQLIVDGASYARDRKYILRQPRADNRVIRLNSAEESSESWIRVGFSAVAV
ncbi:MAG: hypothetical protein WC474_08035 [Hydrogenophilaceae bacterium]